MAESKKSKPDDSDDSDEECIVEDMGSDDEQQEDDEEDMEVNDEVQVNFQGLSISDNDFHGIRQMLQQLFPKDHVDISEISNILIGQNFMGSVLKQCGAEDEDSDDDDDDDDVLGISSCISCNGMHKPNNAIVNVIKYLIQRCEKYATDGDTKTEFKKLMESSKDDTCFGWVINERFINIPAMIALPMFSKLKLEIKEANEGKHKNCYDFSHYVMICKTYNTKQPEEEGKKFSPEKIEFTNREEQFFADKASLKFTFPLIGAPPVMTGKWDEDAQEMQPSRTVIVLTKDSILDVIDNLEQSLAF